jgi:phosphoribosylaminoimidazolecarboxamide formyltransferase/IMP cyclohydrolase
VIVDPDDYPNIVREMKQNQGHVSIGTNFRLAKKVFQLTARYDTAISTYLQSIGEDR